MTSGGRRRLPSPASPLENDDLLSDILLRLPPAPSSLPRASLVCKRWRRLVSDPAFLRRFRARHRRNAPLLGCFTSAPGGPSFTPTLEPPDRLPHGSFSLNLDDGYLILGCRHGLVLISVPTRRELVVWEPVTGDLSRFAFPPGFGDGGARGHGGTEWGGGSRCRRHSRWTWPFYPLPCCRGRLRRHTCVRLRLRVGDGRMGQSHLNSVPVHVRHAHS
ncbi:hypothetical protein ACP70R_029363 [Stipagrostis hirtigluma subsp. patula]